MKIFLIGIWSGLFLLSGAVAQNGNLPAITSSATQPPPTESAHSGPLARIAPGSVIPVSLAKTIDAKKAKDGDEVTATVTQDLKNNSGEVIVAKDTKVMGHITEAQARNKEQKESQVAIVFDHAVMKNGGEIAMPMSIQAIIGSQNNSAQNPQENGEGVSTGGGASTMPGTSARPGMAGSSPTPAATMPAGSDTTGDSQASQANHNGRVPVTAQTAGVVGISDLQLAPAANSSQGSMVTSEKSNVKIESGTMMLLRVNK
jgi:hypothetical protein